MGFEIDKNFRGNAYIVKVQEILLDYSGGFADLANEIPNTFETRFASASMGKTFVAVGILALAATRNDDESRDCCQYQEIGFHQ